MRNSCKAEVAAGESGNSRPLRSSGKQREARGNSRVAPTKTKNGCNRVYLRGLSSVTRKTPYSAEELSRQATFASISAQVQARRKRTSPTYDADYAAFLAQRDSKGGEPTFVSYLWKVIKGN